MTESPLFYSIKDVAKQLGLPSHVLRFWETKFPEIKPVHRSGSCRYYRKEDVDLLIKIQDLLHNQGYTIKGARSVLAQPTLSDKEQTTEKKVLPSSEKVADSAPISTENNTASNKEIMEKLLVLRDFVKESLEESKKL